MPSTPSVSTLRFPHPPPMHYAVDVKATSNDPVQRITAGNRIVTINGKVDGTGFAPSVAHFTIEGKKISVPLSRGMTAEDTMNALRRRLPSNYRIQVMANATPPFPGFVSELVSFNVMKTGPSVPASVEKINKAFSKATRAGSEGKEKVTYAELRTAVRAGLADGYLTVAEKQALAVNWAGLFTGAGYLATEAAQREYAKLQKRHDLPVIPVF